MRQMSPHRNGPQMRRECHGFEEPAIKLKEKGWGKSLHRAVSIVRHKIFGKIGNQLWQ